MVRNYIVVHRSLVVTTELRKGETLMVLGAAGACGLAAIDLGKALGARVIAAASNATKLAACRAAGADVVIDYEEGGAAGFIAAMRAAKVYGTVNAIFDPVGGRYAEAAFRAMAPGGRHVVFGFAAGGTNPNSAFPNFPINLLLMRGQRIIGAMGRGTPASDAAAMRDMLGMVESGRLRPVVSRTYPLRDFKQAFDDLSERRAVGKVVISIAGDGAKL